MAKNSESILNFTEYYTSSHFVAYEELDRCNWNDYTGTRIKAGIYDIIYENFQDALKQCESIRNIDTSKLEELLENAKNLIE